MVPAPATATPARRKWRNRLLWLVCATVLCVSLILLAMRFLLAPWVRQQLVERVHTGSQGRYALQVDHLGLDLLGGSVHLRGLHLTPTPAGCATWPDSLPQWEIRIARLDIRRTNYWHLWQNNRLHLNAFQLDSAWLRMQPAVRPPKPDSTDALDRTLQRTIGNAFYGGLRLKHAAIRNLTLVIAGDAPQQVENLHLTLRNLHIDSSAATDTSRLYFAQHLDLNLRRYTAQNKNGQYQWQVDHLSYQHPARTLRTGTVVLRPRLVPYAFAAAQRYHTDRFALRLDSTRATGLAFGTGARLTRIAVTRLDIFRPVLDIQHDKRLRPVNPTPRRYPHELLADLATPVAIHDIRLHNGTVTYTQRDPGKDKPLVVQFLAVQAQIRNVAAEKTLQLHATTRFLGQTPLRVAWTYPLQPGPFNCRLTGSLGRMPATGFNPMLQPGKVQVAAGTLYGVQFDVQVRNGAADGWLLAEYQGLKVQVQDEKKGRASLLTAVANLVIPSRNRSRANPNAADTARIVYTREPLDGLPRFLWRSVKSGLVATLVPVKAGQKALKQRQ